MDNHGTIMLGGKVSPELAQRVRALADRTRNPYAPTVSQFVARGVELAVQEYERKREAANGR